MVADVQGWLDQPATNFGWILIGNEAAPTTTKRFDTRESPISSNRPVLEVAFTPRTTPVKPDTWGRIKAIYRRPDRP